MSIFRRDLPDPPPGRAAAGARPSAGASARPAAPSEPAVRVTTIAAGTKVKGEINGAADLAVDGHFEGEIRLDSEVTVGGDGRVKGKIEARSVRIGGQVRGDVVGNDLVELLPTARLEGNVKAARVIIAEGSFFKGNVAMAGDNGKR